MHPRRVSTRLLVGGLTALLAGVGATFPQSSASADPAPGTGNWPMCGTAPDTDGRYCVVSMTRNGVDITHPASGDYYLPYIDMIGPGDVRFGVEHYRDGALVTRDNGAGGLMADGELVPGDVFDIEVNTGAVVPRELFVRGQDVTFTRGGNATDGYRFGVRLQPTPFAWLKIDDGSPWPCTVQACGDDSTIADPYWVYDGFITGYVTDISWASPAEQRMMTGLLHAYNAQDANLFYDYDTNAMVIQLANPHLKEPGVVATGAYQTFLPYSMLTGMMNVPDPTTLTGGSFLVSRAGSGTTVPFTLTHHPAGVEILIPDITYSTPTYRIKPRRSAPGQPQLRRVVRVAPNTTRVKFTPPVANGGAVITGYRARCRRGTAVWHYGSATASPIRVRNVPRRPVTCQVRAINRIGAGAWSLPKRG
ncbi:MAG: hypothetical protein Q8Q02_12485 [Nocardioides sp.]|nr:hypothetical protein [Nocardioides sp.]